MSSTTWEVSGHSKLGRFDDEMAALAAAWSVTPAGGKRPNVVVVVVKEAAPAPAPKTVPHMSKIEVDDGAVSIRVEPEEMDDEEVITADGILVAQVRNPPSIFITATADIRAGDSPTVGQETVVKAVDDFCSEHGLTQLSEFTWDVVLDSSHTYTVEGKIRVGFRRSL